jgi:hypothetical protein
MKEIIRDKIKKQIKKIIKKIVIKRMRTRIRLKKLNKRNWEEIENKRKIKKDKKIAIKRKMTKIG